MKKFLIILISTFFGAMLIENRDIRMAAGVIVLAIAVSTVNFNKVEKKSDQ